MRYGRHRLALTAAILLAALVTLGLAGAARAFLADRLNSDALYLPSLYDDLFVDGYAVSGWTLPPAPYLFPDALLYMPLRALTGDHGLAFAAYALLFGALLTACAWNILASTPGREPTDALLRALGALLLILCVVLTGENEMSSLFMPTFHGGALLCGLTLLALQLRLRLRGPGLRALLALFAIAALGMLSDAFLFTQFVLPSALTWLALSRLRACKERTAWAMTGALSGGALAGFLLRIFVQESGLVRIGGLTYRIGFADVSADFLGDLLAHMRANPAVPLILAGWVLHVAMALRSRRRTEASMSGECPGPSDAPFLVIFSTLAVAMTLATPWLARIWFDHWSLRYMYPLLVVPVLALADGGWLSLDRLGHAVAAGILILGTAVIGSQSVYLSLASLKYPYPEKIRCLDRVAMDFGVRHGLGGYWTAKYVSQLSRAGLRVNQIDPDLRVDPWINNLNWYGPRGEERAYPDYRFVVTDGLSAPRLVQTFGTPDLLARCADWTVLLYGEESGSPLRRFRLSP